MPNEYSVVLVDDLPKFDAIKDNWNNLASHYSEEYVFMSHDWYELWLKYFLKDNKLCIITVNKGDKLVAIAPFIYKLDVIKKIPVVKLEAIGNAYSPLRSFVIDKSEDSKKLGSLLSDSLQKLDSWDIAQIGPIYEGKLYEDTKELLSNFSYRSIEKVVDTNWRLECSGLNYDTYLSNRKRGVRQEIKRRNKKIEELGEIDIRIMKGEEALDHIDDYCLVYEKSWKQSEHLGPGFHKDFAKIAVKGRHLLLALMYLNGNPIAAQYRIQCGDKCFFMKTAYDDKYQKFSVGLILLNHVLKYLMDVEGIKTIDFGPGNEAYKADWAEIKLNYNNIYLLNRTMKGSIIHFAYTKVSPIISRFKNNGTV